MLKLCMCEVSLPRNSLSGPLTAQTYSTLVNALPGSLLARKASPSLGSATVRQGAP